MKKLLISSILSSILTSAAAFAEYVPNYTSQDLSTMTVDLAGEGAVGFKPFIPIIMVALVALIIVGAIAKTIGLLDRL